MTITWYPSKAKAPLLASFYGGSAALLVGGYLAMTGGQWASGFLGLSGALFQLAGAISAGLSAWLRRGEEFYGDRPSGPPSSFTRELFHITATDAGPLGRFHAEIAWGDKARATMLAVGFVLAATAGFF